MSPNHWSITGRERPETMPTRVFGWLASARSTLRSCAGGAAAQASTDRCNRTKVPVYRACPARLDQALYDVITSSQKAFACSPGRTVVAKDEQTLVGFCVVTHHRSEIDGWRPHDADGSSRCAAVDTLDLFDKPAHPILC